MQVLDIGLVKTNGSVLSNICFEAKMSSCQDVKVNIQMNGEQFEEGSAFKYLGAIIRAVKKCEQGLDWL